MKPKTHLSTDLARLAHLNRNESYGDRLASLAKMLPTTEKRSYDKLIGNILTSPEHDHIFFMETLKVLQEKGQPFQPGVTSVTKPALKSGGIELTT